MPELHPNGTTGQNADGQNADDQNADDQNADGQNADDQNADAPDPASPSAAPHDDDRQQREHRQGFTPAVPSPRSRLRRAFTKRPDTGQVAVAVLVFLLGFAGAIQIAGDEDDALANARRADLIQALNGLTLQGERLEEQVTQLEADRRELVSTGGSEEATLAQAQERLRQLNVLAGVEPATGPGIEVSVLDPEEAITAVVLLSAIHELRSAGAEAIQIGGANGETVRVVNDSYFVDADGDVVVDGAVLEPPYTLTAIGDPNSLGGAIEFTGGLADDAREEDGDVVVEESDLITVDVVRDVPEPRYASPSPDDD